MAARRKGDFAHRALATTTVLSALAVVGSTNAPNSAIAANAGDECNYCENDCGYPPPWNKDCEDWCLFTFCSLCTAGNPPECANADCEDLEVEYWEGQEMCGYKCDEETIFDPCPSSAPLLIDATLHGPFDFTTGDPESATAPETGQRIVIEAVASGVVYRSACNGMIVGRRYSDTASRTIAHELAALTL